jgi:UDP-N-acetylmuramoylalanine--D-glutamate ligase
VKNYVVAQDFATALKLATQNATSGDVVLLSPACASFDQFECFEQRGEKFIEYVNSL